MTEWVSRVNDLRIKVALKWLWLDKFYQYIKYRFIKEIYRSCKFCLSCVKAIVQRWYKYGTLNMQRFWTFIWNLKIRYCIYYSYLRIVIFLKNYITSAILTAMIKYSYKHSLQGNLRDKKISILLKFFKFEGDFHKNRRQHFICLIFYCLKWKHSLRVS